MAIVFLILPAVIGIAIYKTAGKCESQYGESPWGVPPIAWGFIGFAFGLIGLLLYYFAEKSVKRRALQRQSMPYASQQWAPQPAPQWAPPQPQQWAPPQPSPQWAPPPPPGYGNAPWAPTAAPPPPPNVGPQTPPAGGHDSIPRR